MISYTMKQIKIQEQKIQEQITNGVNVSKLYGTIEAIKESPEIAEFNFKARGKWVNGDTIEQLLMNFMEHVRIPKEKKLLSLKKTNQQYC
jgi:hypothetical protein